MISSRFSGTSVAWSGFTSQAIARISGSQAISRLSLTVTVWRRIRRSRSEMWRRSSRRWRVMPSAPPISASAAAQTGSGSLVRRACRTVAT